LQEGTLVRLGGTREVTVNVRLVAATNRELAAEVQAGRFRQDLYYRLNVIPIRLPSLRERGEDIRALALHFVNRANQTHQRNVNLAPDALARLQAHPWPGNIRELGNLIERLVLLADHTLVTAETLERFMPQVPGLPNASPPGALPAEAGQVRDYQSARSHSAQVLQDALAQHQGNQSRAAQSLGLTLRQFSYRLRKTGLR
jgi:Nif-specific regulatory protein